MICLIGTWHPFAFRHPFAAAAAAAASNTDLLSSHNSLNGRSHGPTSSDLNFLTPHRGGSAGTLDSHLDDGRQSCFVRA